MVGSYQWVRSQDPPKESTEGRQVTFAYFLFSTFFFTSSLFRHFYDFYVRKLGA